MRGTKNTAKKRKGFHMEQKIRLTVTEGQLKLINRAMEEYFRLRLNQWNGFADDICAEGCDFSKENPKHDDIFSDYIVRRNTLVAALSAIFAALSINKRSSMKSQDCIDAIDIYETIMHWLWEERPDAEKMVWTVDSRKPLNEGQYPLPKIEKVEG